MTSASDRRHKNLALSESGETLLRVIDKELYRLTADTLSGLSSAEESSLVRFVSRLASRLGSQTAGKPRILEHPLNWALARLSTALEIYSGRILGGLFSLPEVQALAALSESPNILDAPTLTAAIGTDRRLARFTMRRLQEKNLLERTIPASDRNVPRYRLTQSGKRAWETHLESVARRFEEALTGIAPAELDEFLTLLLRCSDGEDPEERVVIQDRIEVRKLREPAARSAARGFFVAEAVRLGTHFRLEETLFGRGALSFGLFLNGSLRGTCEARRQSRRWDFINLSVAAEIDSAEMRALFVEHCRRALRKED